MTKLNEIPDSVFELSMLRLICGKLKIKEEEIQQLAEVIFDNEKNDKRN